MTKKKWKTAQELMAELQSDPGFRRLEAERERKWQELADAHAVLESPILDKLKELGFRVASITDAVKKYSPLPAEVVEVFLDAVRNSTDVGLLETLIRALAAADHPFDGRPIVNCYESAKEENLKWVIANTIALVRPHSIDDWIDRALEDPVLGKTLRELGFFR